MKLRIVPFYVGSHVTVEEGKIVVAIAPGQRLTMGPSKPVDPALALAHELGHVATLTKKQITARSLTPSKRQSAELIAWVAAFARSGDRRVIKAAASALASYGVPKPLATLNGLLDIAGVPKRAGRRPVDKRRAGVID